MRQGLSRSPTYLELSASSRRCTEMSFSSTLKTYLDNSSVHGFPHITNTNKSLAERGFWAVICSLAGYAAWMLLQATLHSYENNAVSFIVDPDYLHFNTTFPSLSICEKDDLGTIKSAAEKIYGPDRNLNIGLFIRDIAYFDGSCGTCNTQCQDSLNCSGDLEYIVKMTRKPCADLIKNCAWNEQPFDCCSEFLPLQTEIGPCFSINSANTVRTKKAPRLQFSLNRQTGPGKLTFTTKDPLNLYLHSLDDVPTINHPRLEKTSVSYGSEFRWVIKILEIYNDPLLKSLPIERRNCRFPEEKILRSYDTYSFSGCLVDCRARAQQQFCNCTHHLMPKIPGVKPCDLDGLRCLSKLVDQLRSIQCNCTSSCVEPDFDIISKRFITDPGTGNEESDEKERKIVVRMDGLPNVRLMRVVVRTKLDLVVGMGSTIGLFLGASLLSSVEIPYFLFIRKRRPNKTLIEKFNTKLTK